MYLSIYLYIYIDLHVYHFAPGNLIGEEWSGASLEENPTNNGNAINTKTGRIE